MCKCVIFTHHWFSVNFSTTTQFVPGVSFNFMAFIPPSRLCISISVAFSSRYSSFLHATTHKNKMCMTLTLFYSCNSLAYSGRIFFRIFNETQMSSLNRVFSLEFYHKLEFRVNYFFGPLIFNLTGFNVNDQQLC